MQEVEPSEKEMIASVYVLVAAVLKASKTPAKLKKEKAAAIQFINSIIKTLSEPETEDSAS